MTPEQARLLAAASDRLMGAFARLPEYRESIDPERIQAALTAAAERLADNYPYQHPLYAGQMLKPPHPVARLAYAVAMELNPNNHALDGGRASSRMEKEAVAALAQMIGFDAHLGHLTGGGTIANLEALWVAREWTGGTRVLASTQAHYTHSRMSAVLGLEFVPVEVDAYGRMDTEALEGALESGDKVACVVATLGTTGPGAVDPLERILPVARRAEARVHVDAAYGGYFRLVAGSDAESARAFEAMASADSVVIDPHKHGLQPYGCGAVLFRDAAVGRVYRHDSPYTYFTSDELHLGEISLECSRPGAAAVALWTTLQMLPLQPHGEFARGLEDSLAAARALYEWVGKNAEFAALMPPVLDIVVFGARARTATAASARAQAVFDAAAALDLHLALCRLPRSMVASWWPELEWDADQVTVLRSCLMKPAHREWMGEITKRLAAAAA